MKVLELFPQRDTNQSKFEEFHRDNPPVYDLLVKFARQAKASGCVYYSVYAVMHRVRWYVRIELRLADDNGFKINNNFGPRYARMIMEKEPDLKDFFETRRVYVP